jgi:hypothetical protein
VRRKWGQIWQEFSYDKLWGGRASGEIFSHLTTVLFLSLLPTLWDVLTDWLLWQDFTYGADYTKLVKNISDPSVINNINRDCTQTGFYVSGNQPFANSSERDVDHYTFTCFEKDPNFAIATLVVMGLPGLGVIYNINPVRKPFCSRLMALLVLTPILVIFFPIWIFLVKIIHLLNPGAEWRVLADRLTYAEGTWESSFQFTTNVFVIFTMGDRQPSTLQLLATSISLLTITKTRVGPFLNPKLSVGDKIVATMTLMPVALTNTVFKLGTIAVVISILRYNTIYVYLILGIFCVVSPVVAICYQTCRGGHDNNLSKYLWQGGFHSSTGLSYPKACMGDSFPKFLLPFFKEKPDCPKFTPTERKKIIRNSNLFWFFTNITFLASLLLAINVCPDCSVDKLYPFLTDSYTLSSLPIVHEISYLNTIVIVMLICGFLTNVLIYVQFYRIDDYFKM